MQKKIIIVAFAILFSFHIYSTETKKLFYSTYNIISFAYSQTGNFVFSNYLNSFNASLFADISFKCDYQLFKGINTNNKIGIGLSSGVTVNVGIIPFEEYYDPWGFPVRVLVGVGLITASTPLFILTASFQPFIIPRFSQKITISNLVGSDWAGKYTLIEGGNEIELGIVARNNSLLYINFSGYFFVGYSAEAATRFVFSNASFKFNHILGGFFQIGASFVHDNSFFTTFFKIGYEYRLGRAFY